MKFFLFFYLHLSLKVRLDILCEYIVKSYYLWKNNNNENKECDHLWKKIEQGKVCATMSGPLPIKYDIMSFAVCNLEIC